MKKGNKKRILASLMAGTMALSLMPVSAFADNSTTTSVNLDVEDTIVRVQVPTYARITIDEFEQNAEGTQIYSPDFEIQNLSSTAVKVSVNTKITKDTGVNLVGTRDGVSDDSDAWIAAVAAVSKNNGNYIYLDGATSNNYSLLSEKDTNVATAVTAADTNYYTDQEFYLAAATGSPSHEIIDDTNRINAEFLDFAQIYALTAEAAPTDLTEDTDNDSSDDAFVKDELLNRIVTNKLKLFYIDTLADNTHKVLFTIDKESLYDNIDDLSAYYTEFTTAKASEVSGAWYTIDTTTLSDITTAKADSSSGLYLYSQVSGPSDNGVASFRYIGALGEKNSADWSATELSNFTIKYTIKCLGQTAYNEVKDDLVLGYAPAVAKDVAPVFSLDTSTGVITYTEGSGSLALDENKEINLVGNYEGGDELILTKTLSPYWTSATIDTTANTITLSSGALSLLNKHTNLHIEYNDGIDGDITIE